MIFYPVPSTIFQIFPSIGDIFFLLYLQTPLFPENLRPILPPRLYYFQYYRPFNILELLSIPELCISILSLKKKQTKKQENKYYHGPPKGACDQTKPRFAIYYDLWNFL